MLHGAGVNKMYLSTWATEVAQRGAVVFAPDWGIVIGNFANPFSPVILTPQEMRAQLPVELGDVAAIIRFARATGPSYGGDADNLTLFGHSGGANQALMEPFSGVAASEGALQGAGSTIPESLVVFDADYLLAGATQWDDALARGARHHEAHHPLAQPGPADRLSHHHHRIGRPQLAKDIWGTPGPTTPGWSRETRLETFAVAWRPSEPCGATVSPTRASSSCW